MTRDRTASTIHSTACAHGSHPPAASHTAAAAAATWAATVHASRRLLKRSRIIDLMYGTVPQK